ncbi:hypothetical protein ACFXPX_36755 [Kitasatospora sp. NPDC059146]|uniref:hypothetical protein n=1 Tax=unclassified Kitasatospora TaxID=2633591 RepID=UPI003683D559
MPTTVQPRTPKKVAETAAQARRYGWECTVAWEPAGPTNTGPQFIVTLTAEPLRGAAGFRLVWLNRNGRGYLYQPHYSRGRYPGQEYQRSPVERADVESAVRNNPVYPVGGEPVDWPRDWTTEGVLPPTVEELTPAVLAEVRRIADRTGISQSVWPSRFTGGAFLGLDCLVTSASAGWARPGWWPRDAVPGSEPMLTVLPAVRA